MEKSTEKTKTKEIITLSSVYSVKFNLPWHSNFQSSLSFLLRFELVHMETQNQNLIILLQEEGLLLEHGLDVKCSPTQSLGREYIRVEATKGQDTSVDSLVNTGLTKQTNSVVT